MFHLFIAQLIMNNEKEAQDLMNTQVLLSWSKVSLPL